jgi:sulfoxide reductase catalytic subunit YedY
MHVRARRGWELPERDATPESFALSRRAFLGSVAAGAIAAGCGAPSAADPRLAATLPRAAPPYPFRRNARFALDGNRGARRLTGERIAAAYNNFYELASTKDVWRHADAFRTEPWSVAVTGLVARPRTYSLDELLRTMPLEERVYRHRCVEAWAMVVPWSGFPLAALLRRVEPLAAARYVRFVSAADGAHMPGVAARPWQPWPYTEGLRLDEAMHELTFAATGIYGHALPKQHGAPLRIATPWKYGYKSAKAVVRIELVDRQPRTFWNELAPNEYPFESNVDPALPHPRWSQLTERLIGTWDVRRTVAYNGYGPFVAGLYRA